MERWYFPYGYGIEKESVNNARIETFRDNVLESLARETCQNSIDAVKDESKPVRMVFEEKSIDISDVINKKMFINEIIPKALKTWESDKKTEEFLSKYTDNLNSDKIRILRISDYNTTGLEDANWESLIENAGISVKGDDSSAGSFGIGKAAPFASSDLRMVFYSTKTISGEEKAIGVTKFISFDLEDGSTAQGVGYLGKHEKEPLERQFNFDFKEREESGTDLYIIGFNQSSEWKDEIVRSLIENFMVSIYKEMLTIRVNDIEIDKDTMGEIIKGYSGKKYDELKNYYSVLENYEQNQAELFYLDERFEKYGFKKDDAIFITSKSENANRSVLMTRKAGMKIKDRKNISGSIQFNGIFHATGNKINAILKEMENPNHNDWVPERYEKNVKMAKQLKQDIYRFMKDKVINSFQEKIEKQVDAYGISDFLPNRLRNDQEETDNELLEESLESKVTEIKLIENKNRKTTQNVVNEDDIESELIKAGLIDDPEGENSGDSGSSEGSEGSGDSGSSEGLGGSEGSGKREKRNKPKAKEKYSETDKIKYRILDKNIKFGEYIINIESKKKINKLKAEIKLIAENGARINPEIVYARYDYETLEKKDNNFYLENLIRNKNYRVEFKLPYQDRVKMEVKFYESR